MLQFFANSLSSRRHASSSRTTITNAFWLLLLGVLVFTIASVAIEFTRGSGRIAAIWPTNGIVLAIMLWRSRAAWRYILAVAAMGLFTANMVEGDTLFLAVTMTTANVVEVLIIASLFVIGSRPVLLSLRGISKLFLCTAIGCAASTAIALTGLASTGSSVVLHETTVWLLADALGIALFTPATKGLLKRSNNIHIFRFGADQIVAFIAAISVVAIVFFQSDYPLLFLVPPALVGIAFTSGIRGSALGLFATTVIAVPMVLADHGPTSLMQGEMSFKILVLQSFLVVNSIMTFAIAGSITQRRRLTTHLERSQRHLKKKTRALNEMLGKARLAEEMSQVGHWTLDPNTGAVFWSPEVYAIHGVTPDEFDPNFGDAIQFYEEDDRARIEALIAEGIKNKTGWSFEAVLIRASDGNTRDVLSMAECLLDADGNVEAFLGVFRDVTEQKRANKIMRESERRYRMLAEHATDIVLQFDMNGIVKFVSPSCSLLGIMPEDAIGKSAMKFVHPDDHKIAQQAIIDLLHNTDPDTTIRSEHRAPKAGGGYIWLESIPVLIRDKDGKPKSVISSYRDVTDRKRMEDQLYEREQQYRMLAEHSTDIILQTTKGGVISYASPSCEKLGVTPAEAVGMRTIDFVLPEDREKAIALSRQHFSGETPDKNVRREYRVRDKDGNIIWLEGNPTVINDSDGKTVSIINALRDVTDRREREDMLAAAREEAEAAARAKSDFLSNMSHEIRTPLNGVLGFTQLMGRTDLTADQRFYVDRIEGAGRMLRELVDDVLDFSKIESGHLQIEDNAFCVREVLNEVIDLVDAGRKNKDVPIHSHIDPTADMAIMADETRVRQILTNILGNAAKFTKTGRIDVSATVVCDTVRISVEDTGIGISQQNLRHVFDEFKQADSTISRKFGGTGLGLSISRSLASLMGGDLQLESMEGEGTTVTLTLPFKRAKLSDEDVALPAADTVATETATIVVVDDVEANLSLIDHALKHTGYNVVTFESGRKAVEFLRMSSRVDLVLMDIQMPGMDGLAATAAIRKLHDPVCNVPVIALTANALASQVAEYRAAGMDDHIAKPIDLELLETKVAELIRSSQSTADETSATDESDNTDAFEELRQEYLTYLQSVGEEITQMLNLPNQEDAAEKIAGLAHAIAGTAGSYGFSDVSEAAFALEAMAKKAASSPDRDAEFVSKAQALIAVTNRAA